MGSGLLKLQHRLQACSDMTNNNKGQKRIIVRVIEKKNDFCLPVVRSTKFLKPAKSLDILKRRKNHPNVFVIACEKEKET